MPAVLQAAVAGGIAAVVGLAELVGRYRSSPLSSLKQPSALLYIVLNGIAGGLALYLVRAFGWNFNQTREVTLWRVLVAGFGAVALFRSSLFVTRIGSTTLNVGPSIVLGSLLDACDRSVDRASAKVLVEKVGGDKRLAALDPNIVITPLPVLCLALMQNLPDSDAALLGTNLKQVREDTTVSVPVKARATVIHLARTLSPDVVRVVIDQSIGLLSTAAIPPASMQPDANAIQWVLSDVRESRRTPPTDP